MSNEKITTVEQGKEKVTALKAQLKTAKSSVEKLEIKKAILTTEATISLLKAKAVDEKKLEKINAVKKQKSAIARACRNYGLICVALGVLYREHKIDEFNKICENGRSAVEEFATTNFGFKKKETK